MRIIITSTRIRISVAKTISIEKPKRDEEVETKQIRMYKKKTYISITYVYLDHELKLIDLDK